MGNRTIRTLEDFSRYGLDFAVKCLRCGRIAVFCADDVLTYFQHRGWPITMPVDPRPFRCTCGVRRVEVFFTFVDQRPPLPPRLLPLYVREREGIPSADRME